MDWTLNAFAARAILARGYNNSWRPDVLITEESAQTIPENICNSLNQFKMGTHSLPQRTMVN